MPARDGTGPQGRGSMTGRGMGRCGADHSPSGRGAGCGRGLRRNGFRARSLEEQQIWLQNRLDVIQNEIDATKEK